jgi:hypothetical protein
VGVVGALSLPAVELGITRVSPINLHTSYANHCRHHQISVATIKSGGVSVLHSNKNLFLSYDPRDLKVGNPVDVC